jgi:lycopene cyclase domain-containing protein
MNPKYLYLTLNVLSFIFPFFFSFYPPANFSRKWKFVFPAMLITAMFFIVWDEAFTRMNVWGFNPQYLSGIYLYSLPVEEILFFFCIPYACVFTFFALNHLIVYDYFASYQRAITILLAVVLLLVGLFNIQRWYTGVTFILAALFLLYLTIQAKPSYMGRFYVTFLVILIPFFIVNGILTGTFIGQPVVWYDDTENLGIRMGTIPVEDAIYGMLLILMNISIAERLEKRYAIKYNSPGSLRGHRMSR